MTPVVEKPAIVEPAKETVKPAVEAEPSATSVKVTTRTVAQTVETPVAVEPVKEVPSPVTQVLNSDSTSVKITSRVLETEKQAPVNTSVIEAVPNNSEASQQGGHTTENSQSENMSKQ